jgi:hypothetical protein|tara:strand:- start:196 stop:825 length:630 start_codon:yes stop_codon:yes gene_type:complete
MKKYKGIIPPQHGWLEVVLDNDEIDFLWKSIENRGRDEKPNLAGQIDSSYLILDKDNWFYDNTLEKLCNIYSESFSNVGDNLPTPNKHPYFLQTMWVNYQKQTEFNPTHYHKGIYSFVIWMKIPTEFNIQKENPISKNTNNDVISNFCFEYRDMIGEYRKYVYKMSKEMEGKMLFFPSNLTHAVYPFYNCSENRISISGNIGLNTNLIM